MRFAIDMKRAVLSFIVFSVVVSLWAQPTLLVEQGSLVVTPEEVPESGQLELAIGVTNETATNYQPLATVDDGSCVFQECESTCPNDLNGDGAIGTPDLLSLLSSFGAECE